MDARTSIGLGSGGTPLGLDDQRELHELTRALLNRESERAPCPADKRIEQFLNAHFEDVLRGKPLRFPSALNLSRHGLARALSLPENGDTFSNEYLTSYRVRNGVLHNPRSDRRTTSGTYHVCEGGLPIARDKKAEPRSTIVA